MKLIYGTYNPSKLESMKKMLEGLNISISGLADIDRRLVEAEENGKEPIANACEKAKSYYKQLGVPVFSCDSGLYFENVKEEDQPGVFIKRIHGNDLSYKGMLEYYSKLSAKYGGKLTAYYKNAICLVFDEENVFMYDGVELSSEKFYLVEKPHQKYREGFPLDSLSVEIESEKYYYDLPEHKSENLGVIEGFREFFIRSCEVYQKKISK